jgi:hypothetical protein
MVGSAKRDSQNDDGFAVPKVWEEWTGVHKMGGGLQRPNRWSVAGHCREDEVKHKEAQCPRTLEIPYHQKGITLGRFYRLGRDLDEL